MKYFLIILLCALFRYGYSQPLGYSFGKQIVIDASEVSGSSPLIDFPVLISVTDTDLRTTANGGSVESVNGFDIIFTLGDCATLLSHDLESYNPVTGELVVWVQVPSVDNNTNTPFFVFYGNSSVVTDQSTTDIWTDSGYDGVWHLHNDFLDASGSGNNGTNNGSVDLSPANNSADGQSFTDPNDWVELASHPARTGNFSYSAWIRTADNSKTGQRVICDDATNGAGCHAISVGDPGVGRIRLFIRGMAPTIVDSPVGTIANNTWYYVAATFNSSTNLGSLYVDGVVVNSATFTGTIGAGAGNASIGGEVAAGESANRFDGDLDEVRANNSLLSTDWIITEFNNQNSPSTFYTFSSQLGASTLCTTLPIELLNFNATPFNSNSVVVKWQTSSELNNDFFTIERSRNGIDWIDLKNVKGAGTSSTLLTYSETDSNPYRGISYYRLKQTDFDGAFEYSPIRSIKITSQVNSDIIIYPNPSSSEITIIANAIELEQIKILNALGQDISMLTAIIESSSGMTKIDLSNLASGMYVIKTKTTANKVYKQ